MPTTSVYVGSSSRSFRRPPSPQPMSTTRWAPLALRAARTASRRRATSGRARSSDRFRLHQRGTVVELGQAGRRVVDEAALVRQRPAQDGLAQRVAGQPVAAGADELVDLVLAHPVVLAAVEHRQQDVQVRQGGLDRHPAGEAEVDVPARTPRRDGLVEGDGRGVDRPAQGLEQAVDPVSGHRPQAGQVRGSRGPARRPRARAGRRSGPRAPYGTPSRARPTASRRRRTGGR